MSLDEEDRTRLERATRRALDWHGAQSRKGTRIPYMSHLLQVQGLVFEHGGNVDQAVAALLHDCLEDAPSAHDRLGREAIIEHEFGAAVARIVVDCSDTERGESMDEKAPWHLRKKRYLAHLRNLVGHGSPSVLVAACDKRHNLHALVWDLRVEGRGYLDRFNAGPADQVWYFGEILAALAGRIPERLEAELRALLEDFENQLAD